MIWWARKEGNKYFLVTQYHSAATPVRCGANMEDIKENIKFKEDLLALPGELVHITVNLGENLPGKIDHLRGLADDKKQGPFKIYVQEFEDSELELWPQSFGTMGEANNIIKKYMRPAFHRCVVTHV